MNQPKKLGPNDPCHCGSGKKYKKCHQSDDKGSSASIKRLSVTTKAAGKSLSGLFNTVMAPNTDLQAAQRNDDKEEEKKS